MKRLTSALVILMLFISMSFVSVGTAPSASAVDGCSTQVILKGDNWANTIPWQEPSRILPNVKYIRLSATTAYWFCPNGSEPNKIKPKWVEFCWSHLDGESLWFDGVKFNPYFADNNTVTNPPQTKVNDDGTVQNCETQDITAPNEVWLKMRQDPHWTVSSWIVRVAAPDSHHDFRTNMSDTRSTTKYFSPNDDVALGDWHW